MIYKHLETTTLTISPSQLRVEIKLLKRVSLAKRRALTAFHQAVSQKSNCAVKIKKSPAPQFLPSSCTKILFAVTDTMRTQPNIIITGTPGVGKTTHCEMLAQNTGLKHLSINDVVKERGCHDGYDEEFKSWIVDEDKVCIFPCLMWKNGK
jgi:MoxR-like ATPase